MGQYIAEFGGKYLIWSTVVDSPITYLMTAAELRDYIESEEGKQGLRVLPFRLERVRENGVSGFGVKKQDLLALNRAGAQESHIATEEEMIERWTAKQAAP